MIIGSRELRQRRSPQTLGGTTYAFSSWSDGGAQTHTIVAPADPDDVHRDLLDRAATVRASSPRTPSTPAAAPPSRTSPAAATRARSRARPGRPAGKNGGALSFDGVNDWVTVADTAALDLTTAMTLEAWVQPTSTNRWRTVALKEQTGNLVYALYGNNSGQRASANLWLGCSEAEARRASQLPANTWTHLAATYDGATMRLYVNGALSGSTTATGSMPASTGPFRIGGNAIWDEWFAGQLDDLRLYNRALSATEVQADMATPVGPPPPSDTQAPTAPGGLAANGRPELGDAQLDGFDATTSASSATTSTAARPPASRPARPTGSRSPRARATPTLASRPAPTTTASPPRTPPATSAPPRARRRAS